MVENRTWLVFANEKRCNHVKSFREMGFISWVRGRVKFELGDIVYIFISSERKVCFKTQVTEIDVERGDSKYWIGKAPVDNTHKLQLIQEYMGDELNERELMKYGFKGGRSIQTPMFKNHELIKYIDSCFQKQAENVKLK